MIDRTKKRLSIDGDVVKIVKEESISKLMHIRRRRHRLRLVVHQVRRAIHRVILRWWTNALIDEQHIGVHDGQECVVLVRCGLGVQEDTLTLAGRYTSVLIITFDFDGLDVDTVDLDCCHWMLVEDERVAGVVTRTDDMHIVRGIRLDVDLGVLGKVDERANWVWSTVCSDTLTGLVGVDELGHLLVVPVHEGDGEMLVEVEGWVRVVDEEWAEETVWVLAHGVGVVPVGSWTIGLLTLATILFILKSIHEHHLP